MIMGHYVEKMCFVLIIFLSRIFDVGAYFSFVKVVKITKENVIVSLWLNQALVHFYMQMSFSS